MENLEKDIANIVDAHSGGVKWLEMMTELMVKRGYEMPKDPGELMDLVEPTVAKMSEFGLLKYGYKFEENVMREKWFIYRKLP